MLTRQELEELVHLQESLPGPTLSLYLSLDQSHASNLNRGFEAVLKERLRALEGSIPKGEKDLFRESRRRLFSSVRDLTVQGLSLVTFLDASADFLWQRQLQVPFSTQVVWGQAAHMRPLWEALDEYERYGVILTDRASARIFTVFLRRIEEHLEATCEDEVRRLKAAGSDRRLSQKKIQRRADEHARWHLKRVAELMEGLSRRHRFDRLVLAGPAEATAELFGLLSKRLRQRVVDSVRLSVDAPADEVLAETLKIEERVERAGESALVEELITAAAKRERAVLGLERTVRAAQQARVWRLVYPEQATPGGGVCSSCETLHAGTPSRCGYCGEEVERVPDLLERLVAKVLETGGRTEEVRQEAAHLLEQAGGMGAFLRF